MDTRIGLERALIGTLIVDPNDEVTSFSMGYLKPDDFFEPAMRELYAAIQTLYNKQIPIDIITVSETSGQDVGILASLVGESIPLNFRHHAETVKAESVRRKAIQHTEELICGLSREFFTKPDEVVDYMNSRLLAGLPKIDKRPEKMGEIVEEMLRVTQQERNDKTPILLTGMHDLDRNIGSLRKSEFTVIAAGPGTGKTAFAMNLALNASKANRPVMLFSREMNRIQVAKRVIANIESVPAEALRDAKAMSDEDIRRMRSGADKSKHLPLRIDDKAVTIQEIFNKCVRMKERGELDIVLIDYFQLLTSSARHESRRHELDYISRQLKLLTLQLEVPVIGLSQLTREGRKTGEAPKLYHLKETGALEQDADNVIFLWDPKEEANKKESRILVNVIVEKQRNGRTGTVEMWFDKNFQRFYPKDGVNRPPQIETPKQTGQGEHHEQHPSADIQRH